MIIKSRKRLPLLASDQEAVMPVLPIRSAVVFPGEIHTIQVGRPENLELVKAVRGRDNILVLSFSPETTPSGEVAKLSQVGTVAKIQSVKKALGKSSMVTLEGLRRIALTEIRETSPFLVAGVTEIGEEPGDASLHIQTISEILDLVSQLVRLDSRYSAELLYTLDMNKPIPGLFADRVAAMIYFQLADKQDLLETVIVDERLKTVLDLLKIEINKLSTLTRINERVAESLEQKKRESFLRQQLMEIRRELGEEFVEEDLSRTYQKRIKELKSLPTEMSGRLLAEAERLRHLSSSSAEYGSTKNYLDLLLSLPWSDPPPVKIDLKKIEAEISDGYYGLAKTREQVLEYLAIRQISHDGQDAPILCLAGPVGTGKASLAKTISRALGRKLVRLNGASMIAVEDIKGTFRTDIGAGPGHLIRAIQRAGTTDLVIYMEDLEYVTESEDSNAFLALLEAVDPRQNVHFMDTFVGVPVNLSRILFILGISNLEDFPEPFAHRLEVVEMPGYIEKEKIIIAKKHILPKLYRRHGLSRNDLQFSDKCFSRIIRHYTMEAGLVNLQQQLEKVFRRVTRRKAMGEIARVVLRENTIEEYLGTPLFIPEKAISAPEIGVANGLAWTGAGGDLMIIEGLRMRGTGQVTTTGLLGEIMKESIQAAHSFIRSRADVLNIDHDDFVNFDIHIHFPMGAIPKDGPSAGMTVAVVLASVMAERPVRNDIAMTGEITLRGKILPVGGIKEKVSAAYRTGIKTIILPKENEKDIKDLPRDIIRNTSFIFVDTIDGLFEQALLDFKPSPFTLEKLFAREVEKAKRRRSRKNGKNRKNTRKRKKTPARRSPRRKPSKGKKIK